MVYNATINQPQIMIYNFLYKKMKTKKKSPHFLHKQKSFIIIFHSFNPFLTKGTDFLTILDFTVRNSINRYSKNVLLYSRIRFFLMF